MLSLRHIEVFHAVFSTGSVSAAARMLNVSQPSVTTVLRHAESVLGFPLFDRVSGRLVPTADAHVLASEAADILDRVESLRQLGQNLRYGRSGVVRVSALPSLCLKAVPDAVADFLGRHEGVSFDLQTAHHRDVARKLYEREVEIAISYSVSPSLPLTAAKLGSCELVVMYRNSDIPDAPKKIGLGDLQNQNFISLVRSGPIGLKLSRELARQNLNIREVASARTLYIAAALVGAGAGVAVVDRFTAMAMCGSELSYRPLNPQLTFDIYAISLESRPPSELAKSFCKTLSKKLREHHA